LKLDVNALTLPAPRGAADLARALLREAEQALAPLESGDGEEALHDFRVSLRRLRSAVRAFRPQLRERIPRKQERRLRAIAQATTAARDAEVQLAWLAQERAGAHPRDLPAFEWLGRRLEARRGDPDRADLRDLAERFRRLARRLARKLAPAGAPGPGAAGPSLGAVIADLLREHAAELAETLGAVGGPLDMEHGHAARIAGKRLRYLLEPLRGNERADSTAAVAALKELQDVLGELHDAHVAAETMATALADTAAQRARRAHAAVLASRSAAAALRVAARDPLIRGLLFLDGRATERATAAYGRLVQEWLPSRRGGLLDAVTALADALAPRESTRAPAARRFLLAGLPAEAQRAPLGEEETGWLPGPPPRIRLRSVRGPGGAGFLRGAGPSSEERQITEEEFLAQWPGTDGVRLVKHRRALVHRGHRWSIDEIPGLRLVLAEVAAPLAGELPVPPAIRQVLVREVTGERAYQDEQLAARLRRAMAPAHAAPPDPAPPTPDLAPPDPALPDPAPPGPVEGAGDPTPDRMVAESAPSGDAPER